MRADSVAAAQGGEHTLERRVRLDTQPRPEVRPQQPGRLQKHAGRQRRLSTPGKVPRRHGPSPGRLWQHRPHRALPGTDVGGRVQIVFQHALSRGRFVAPGLPRHTRENTGLVATHSRCINALVRDVNCTLQCWTSIPGVQSCGFPYVVRHRKQRPSIRVALMPKHPMPSDGMKDRDACMHRLVAAHCGGSHDELVEHVCKIQFVHHLETQLPLYESPNAGQVSRAEHEGNRIHELSNPLHEQGLHTVYENRQSVGAVHNRHELRASLLEQDTVLRSTGQDHVCIDESNEFRTSVSVQREKTVHGSKIRGAEHRGEPLAEALWLLFVRHSNVGRQLRA
mmetsp:Transcript_47315/g.150753  ORF Transcript_47315/g.150753 Transcript_47315/m.150753 type:complete len:338 (-) Transcript_47315:294-1307(-)